jgi:hypothetical protein
VNNQPTFLRHNHNTTCLGLLKAGGAVLIHDREAGSTCKIACLCLARVDQGADDADAPLALVVRFHGAGLWEGERECVCVCVRKGTETEW